MVDRTIRFGVRGSNGLHGSTWRVWTNPRDRADNVYALCRDGQMAKAMKFSFHATGQCHFHYLPKFYDESVRDEHKVDHGPYIDQWQMPADKVPGVVIMLRVLTPDTALTSSFVAPQTVRWIDGPSMGNTIRVSVVRTAPGIELVSRSNAPMIDSYTLPGGGKVWVGYDEIATPQMPSASGKLNYFRGQSAASVSDRLRVMNFGFCEDGAPMAMDAVLRRRRG
jgi:hypothetical protein